MDLSNPNKLRLREMTDEERGAIMRIHDEGCAIEGYLCDHKWLWQSPEEQLRMSVIYRIAPTADTVVWSKLPDEIKWVARDEDGRADGYSEKPRPSEDIHWTSMGVGVVLPYLSLCPSIYTPGTCDWRESLQQRPEAG